MSGKPIAAALLAGLLVGVVVTMCGCGAAPNPLPLGRVEIPLQATVSTAPLEVREITLRTTWPGDRFEAGRATARVERPDGTSAPVTVAVSADRRTITLGPATLASPGTDEGPFQGTANADVRLIAEIDKQPGEIAGIVLRTRDPGDTLDIAGATGTVYRPDGTDESVAMAISADRTEVTFGRVPLATSDVDWQNCLSIRGPVTVRDGPTGTATEIGYLHFYFDLRPDGTVVAPDTIRVSIPTRGTADDRRIVADGLTPNRDQVWVAIVDQSGGGLRSKLYTADAAGQVIITDTMGRVTADRLSGRKSFLRLSFEDPDRPPGPPPPPPGDGGGPGHNDGSRLNVIALDGPLSMVNGKTGARTEIGSIRFGFEVPAYGPVVAPETISFHVPASGMARVFSVSVTGLEPDDFVQTRVVENEGTVRLSAVYRADVQGSATVREALKRVSADDLSGPNSSLGFYFARTDADGDGVPDAF